MNNVLLHIDRTLATVATDRCVQQTPSQQAGGRWSRRCSYLPVTLAAGWDQQQTSHNLWRRQQLTTPTDAPAVTLLMFDMGGFRAQQLRDIGLETDGNIGNYIQFVGESMKYTH